MGAAHGAGTSNASEISQPTDDYADLMARLQGMCFGLLGDPASMGIIEGGSHTEDERTASTGSVGRFESAGSAHAFDLDLGPLTSQPQGPHAVRNPLARQGADNESPEDRRLLPEAHEQYFISSEIIARLHGLPNASSPSTSELYQDIVGPLNGACAVSVLQHASSRGPALIFLVKLMPKRRRLLSDGFR